MPRDFDTSLKTLIGKFPTDWLRLAGIEPGGPVEVVNSNLASVQIDADKVVRVSRPKPHLVHFETESNYKRKNPQRLLEYNVLLRKRSKLPVTSILILLRWKAAGPAISGILRMDAPSGGGIEFRYNVLRVWELSQSQILGGGPGIWPLLPLVGQPDPKNLRRVITQLEPRVEGRMTGEEAGVFWTTMYLLAGLQFDRDVAKVLLSGVRQMKESTTYQAILEEGREEGRQEGRKDEAMRVLLSLGTRRFGKPSATVSRKLGACDIVALDRFIERILDADSWNDLIAGR